jgi:lauroyl/myristoyl acyltransferase
MIRRAARRAVLLLARRWPQGLYGGLEWLSRVTAPLDRRRATAARIRALFPRLSEAESQRAARELRSAALKSRALEIILARTRGEPVFPPIAVDAAFAAVRGPAILTALHIGAVGGLGGALRLVPGEVTALHRMEWKIPSNITGVYVAATDAAGAAAFYRAVATIRRGGCVLMLVDGTGPEVSLLGRRMTLKRGPFALSRMTGAPVIPLFPRWNGASVEVVCGETIAPLDDEAQMVDAMAVVLERHLLEHPATIGYQLLVHLSQAPHRPVRRAAP